MTPDLTLQNRSTVAVADRNTRPTMTIMITQRESLESKDNTTDCGA